MEDSSPSNEDKSKRRKSLSSCERTYEKEIRRAIKVEKQIYEDVTNFAIGHVLDIDREFFNAEAERITGDEDLTTEMSEMQGLAEVDFRKSIKVPAELTLNLTEEIVF